MGADFAYAFALEEMITEGVKVSTAGTVGFGSGGEEREAELSSYSMGKFPVGNPIGRLAAAHANDRVGSLRRKQAGKEVEVLGGVGVDIVVEGICEVDTAVFLEPGPRTMGGDGLEEVLDTIGGRNGGRACNGCKAGEEDVESTEDQRIRVGGKIKEVTEG